jgi:nucleotide-binding universal stress UspA family protein
MSEQRDRAAQGADAPLAIEPTDAAAEARVTVDTAPLSPLEAQRAHEDALRGAAQVVAHDALAGSRGRVEEETRQLSERMTREEQARRKALALAAPASAAPAPRRAARLRSLPEPRSIRAMLVALDGTPFAERAVSYVAGLARLTGCELTLGACVREAPRQDEGDIENPVSGGVREADGEGQSESRAQVERLLATRELLVGAGLPTQARIIYMRDVVDGLLALERAAGADVIALATHAREGVERVVLGSVADEVVRHGNGLTFIVPPLAPETPRASGVFTRALVPLDGSDLAEQALGVITPLLRQQDRQASGIGLRTLTLLYVADDRAQVHAGEVYLQQMREALLREAAMPVEIDARVTVGSAPGAIVAWAAGSGPAGEYAGRHDLIVMVTHGRGGARRWLYGSAASYVLSRSEVPVLLVRA